jgi:hypothetical protein
MKNKKRKEKEKHKKFSELPKNLRKKKVPPLSQEIEPMTFYLFIYNFKNYI